MDQIVRDSSIYKSKASAVATGYGEIRVGIVREENFDSNSSTFNYLVEIQRKGRRTVMSCKRMVRFGDPYNYEEWNMRPNKTIVPSSLPTGYQSRVGEVVIVAPIDGNYSDGIILGSLRHPSHAPKIKSNEISYASEFNGLETTIDKDGAYKVKFQGTPITASLAEKSVPGTPIPPPAYNPVSAGSYYSFDKDGSYEINDGSAALPQSLKIDKPGGKFTIKSGNVVVEIDKLSQKVAIKCIDLDLAPSKSFKLSTLDAEASATKSIKIKSPKIAIGFGGTELFDSLVQLIDALGTLIVNSPTGPCSPLQAAPTWAQVVAIKTKLNLVKGSL